MSRAGAFVVVLCALAARAHADPSAAQAQSLFDQAKALMGQGHYAEACDAFDASQKLGPSISTFVNLAYCREKNQQYATAWGMFVDAERELRTVTDASGTALHATVEKHAADLQPRLSTLTISVPASHRIAGLEVRRDDAAVATGVWERPLPVDGGSYTITARAPGRQPWSKTVAVAAERDTQLVEVPELPLAGATTTPPDRVVHVEPTPPRAPGRSLRLPIGFGAGAVVLGVAAIGIEHWASSTYSDSLRTSDADAKFDLWQRANHRRYVAEGVGVVAVGAAGTAVFLYLRGRGHEQRPAATAVVPTLIDGHAGLGLDTSW